jgi:Xaa-Pro aminopeptidase
VECNQDTIRQLKPGVPFAAIYTEFQTKLEHYGFQGLNLYGPAHGTGLQECEGHWVDNRSDLIVTPNMAFGVDIWIADETYGVRIEDCVLITDAGCEEMSSWRREIIQL